MTARLEVKSHLKGGSLKYNPSDRNLLPVFEMKKGYKCIFFDEILQIKMDGRIYDLPYEN